MTARLTATSWLTLLLGALLSAPFGTPAANPPFQVEQVQVGTSNGALTLDASVRFDFSPEALEALSNGVPLTILTQIQVRRRGAWIWEDNAFDLQVRHAIRYKPLSERFEVYRLPRSGGARDFVTRDAALRALGTIRRLPLFDLGRLRDDTEYVLRLKVALDIESLPLPLRPMAYLRPGWKLSSGWTTWPFTP